MTVEPVEFVYFDLGNVLVNFSYDIGARRLAEITGKSADEILNFVFRGPLQVEYESGRISTSQFAAQFNRHFQSEIACAEIAHAASDIFWPNWGMIPLVAGLYASGMPIGILSNTCSAHWDYVSRGRYRFLTEFFQKRVLSFEAGCMKPDRRIYELAAKLTGIAPQRIIFLDDRVENVDAARVFGFQAHLFRSPVETAKILRQSGCKMNY
jgi:putative hydrolase of the HAD superfamily